MSKVTLSMIVKNEADRYLKSALQLHREMIDEAVIIDDGSDDNTVEVCREILDGIPLHIYENEQSEFSNEYVLRKKQWELTRKTNPEWILNLDADEIFESKMVEEMPKLLEQTTAKAIYFRLYDMWDESHYRDDLLWRAHHMYRPFLVRVKNDTSELTSELRSWLPYKQHCGRFPTNVYQLPYVLSPIRIKHMGWANEEDRLKKFNRYMQLDPDGTYGSLQQYESILDPHPHLEKWID